MLTFVEINYVSLITCVELMYFYYHSLSLSPSPLKVAWSRVVKNSNVVKHTSTLIIQRNIHALCLIVLIKRVHSYWQGGYNFLFFILKKKERKKEGEKVIDRMREKGEDELK